MKEKTEGAWLINHTKKIQEGQNQIHDFEDVEISGKCGLILSNFAASDEVSDLNTEKIEAIRRISGIKKSEMDTITRKLEEAKLIEKAKNGSISVLAVTTASVLSHTSNIFQNSSPDNFQKAALELSERTSELPEEENILKEYISDNYKLAEADTSELFRQVETFGFVDFEKIDSNQKLYFNGNLFRGANLKKVKSVLSSIKDEDSKKIMELETILATKACVSHLQARNILGQELLEKLKAVGMYDFNEVSNERENITFLTKPSAFGKFGNPFEEDALDLAKAFVASLYYGINYSPRSRGQIRALGALIGRLVNGEVIGPSTAIGEDYKFLEIKRVIKVTKNKNGYGYFMRLLKKDIGRLALQVLEEGDITSQVVMQNNIMPGSVTNFTGPEKSRQMMRKTQTPNSKLGVADLLRTFRS